MQGEMKSLREEFKKLKGEAANTLLRKENSLVIEEVSSHEESSKSEQNYFPHSNESISSHSSLEKD